MEQPLANRCVAEFFGTLWLVFGGCGTAVFAVITHTGATVGLIGVAFAFGLTVLTGIYAFGHISGGHFNPAVSVGLAVAKRFEWKDLPAYVASQVLGAAAASGLIWAIVSSVPGGFHKEYGKLASNGYGVEHGYYALGGVLVAEAFLTFMFLMIILGATHTKAASGFGGLTIGLGLTLIHLISIPISNTSVNPARSTGPAVFEGGTALTQLWAFWLAPIVGAAIAGVVYVWMRPDEATDSIPVTTPAEA